jgi:hypothetical protein
MTELFSLSNRSPSTKYLDCLKEFLNHKDKNGKSCSTELEVSTSRCQFFGDTHQVIAIRH